MSEGVYPQLEFPAPPADRPYVFMNMVSTIDGKTVSGTRDEPVADLGSSMDHATMRQIEHEADAVLIGAGTLRAIPRLKYPAHLWRFVASGSGNVPAFSPFFTDAPDRSFVVTSTNRADSVPEECQAICLGEVGIDWPRLLNLMRAEMGISRLLVEGGSELNAELLRLELVDELFLTIAPKIKLGRGLPTYAGGEPLARGDIQSFELVENHVCGHEVFLRYRRSGSQG